MGFVTTFAVGGLIEISGAGAGVFKGLAGIQLIPTPEPSSALALAMGVVALSITTRRRMRKPEAEAR